MKTIGIPVTMIQENAYFYYDEETLDGVVVDPGGEGQRLLKCIEQYKINIKGILLSHGHFDHIAAVDQIREATGAPVVANIDEKEILTSGRLNMSFQMIGKSLEVEADIFLRDGEIFSFGEEQLQLIHTPGHTPGGACFYSRKHHVLFSGDTIFQESVGRSDFACGDGEKLIEAIKNKLLVLPSETIVYPGHGPSTSIGYEKQHNPYLK